MSYRATTREDPQLRFDFAMPFGGELNTENRWVIKREEIPWGYIEELYEPLLSGSEKGYPAHSSSVAFGSLYVQELLGLTDRETVYQITENPYIQYFLGFETYQNKKPFDHSLMVTFRKRFTKEMLAKINVRIVSDQLGIVLESESDDDPQDISSDYNDSLQNSSEVIQQPNDSGKSEETKNKGKLIVDATCTPGDIPYPTDLRLLNESRKKTEEIIDQLHEPFIGIRKKPRTYRQRARKSYLKLVKQRKPKSKKIRKAIRTQLGYVHRNLATINSMSASVGCSLELLDKRYYKLLLVINELYNQQQYMYDNKVHRVDDRIVNIYQPHIRPIVRGKAGKPVEFGAKISISLIDGYSFVDRLSWNAYNESCDLMSQIETYRERYGFYPESVHADKIYRTVVNRKYCQSKGIRLSGPALGRPLKETEANKELLKYVTQQQRQDERDRQAVEGKFGQGKRRFSLSHIMTKLANTSETVIMMSFIVMNVEKIVRDLLFCLFFSWNKQISSVLSMLRRPWDEEDYRIELFVGLHPISEVFRYAA